MRKRTLLFALLASAAVITAPVIVIGQSTATQTAKSQPASKHHAAAAKRADAEPSVAEQLKEMKELILQQQAATQQLREQLQQTQQQLQQTQQQLQLTQTTAQSADAKAAAVASDETRQAEKIQAELTTAKNELSATTTTVQTQAKKLDNLDHPDTIAYKGIRIRPGGFLEVSSYFRSHATLSDVATTFSTIPLAGQANTKLTEFGESSRDSRISLRADGDSGSTKLTGYFEMDFFAAGATSNPNQSTSYLPRMRMAWSRAQFGNGWTITGGQMWNLTTLNRKGTEPEASATWIPNTIEAQYSIGYNWGRFAEARFNKHLGTKFNAAFSLDNPSYLNFGATAAAAGVASNGAGGDGNSLVSTCTSTASTANPPVITTACTNTPTYSTDVAPDLIGKLAYDDAKLGHYEVKALGRLFRDRAVATVTVPGVNNHAVGGGMGFGAIVPVVAKKVDFMAQGLFGKGISRYTDSGQYDFVVQSTGQNMQTILGLSSLAGFVTHLTPKLEIDTLFGNEYYGRTTYVASGAVAGYGSPTAFNSGCYYETAALATAAGVSSTCTGNNRDLWNSKLYGYYDVYKGTLGTMRFGAEVDYVERTTWSGASGLAPRGNQKNFFTTMRFILP